MKINQLNTVQLMLNHNQSIERYVRKMCIWPLRQQYIKAIEIRMGWYNNLRLPLEKFVFVSATIPLLFFEIYKRGLEQNIQRGWHSPSTLPLRSTLRLSVLQTYPLPNQQDISYPPSGDAMRSSVGLSHMNCKLFIFLKLKDDCYSTNATRA